MNEEINSKGVEIAIALIGALLGFLGGFIGGWLSLRGARQQVRAIAEQTQGSAHERLYNQNLELLTVIAQYPEVRPYFYNGQILPSNADESHRNRVRTIAEMYSGFLEMVAIHLPQLPDEVRNEWRKFISDVYVCSPVVRKSLLENRAWYSQVLQDIFFPVLRPMSLDDLDAVMAILPQAYEERFFEKREVMANKLSLFPAGCWVCVLDGEVRGYLMSHPWKVDNPPALDTETSELPADCDCYFIHDVAIQRESQKQGLGESLAAKATEVAEAYGFSVIALVAVQKSQPFWERNGFRKQQPSASLRKKLRAYSADAAYMLRQL